MFFFFSFSVYILPLCERMDYGFDKCLNKKLKVKIILIIIDCLFYSVALQEIAIHPSMDIERMTHPPLYGRVCITVYSIQLSFCLVFCR
jgi:hypothetical protein